MLQCSLKNTCKFFIFISQKSGFKWHKTVVWTSDTVKGKLIGKLSLGFFSFWHVSFDIYWSFKFFPSLINQCSSAWRSLLSMMPEYFHLNIPFIYLSMHHHRFYWTWLACHWNCWSFYLAFFANKTNSSTTAFSAAVASSSSAHRPDKSEINQVSDTEHKKKHFTFLLQQSAKTKEKTNNFLVSVLDTMPHNHQKTSRNIESHVWITNIA